MESETFLMHCSALSYNGEVILITAHSGTGKSTHARMWREVFGDKVVMINDDKPFLRFENDRLYAIGSPWDGKHHLSTNAKAPVKAICFLSRGDKDSISPMSPNDALSFIFDQIPRYPDSEYMSKLLSLLDRMLTEVPIYSLICTPTHNAALVAENGMIGEIL
jgi:uridine kinase